MVWEDKAAATERAQLVDDTFPYVVFKIVFVTCVSFVKHCSLLRNTDDEVVCHFVD